MKLDPSMPFSLYFKNFPLAMPQSSFYWEM